MGEVVNATVTSGAHVDLVAEVGREAVVPVGGTLTSKTCSSLESAECGNRAWPDAADAAGPCYSNVFWSLLLGSSRYWLSANSAAVVAGTPRVSRLVMVASRAERLPSVEP